MHVPVLLEEVRQWLTPDRGGVFVDCTVGFGGHARALLDGGAARLIGIDRDASALEAAREALAEFGDRVTLVHADYREVAAVLDAHSVPAGAVTGMLADLGVSSMQLDSEGRGFSFRRDEPLDMRMDQSRGPTAADLLAEVEEAELADVIYQFGEERRSRRIARALVNARAVSPLVTTGQVADLVRRASSQPRGRGKDRGRTFHRIDSATRTFQALRIWVNRELDGLDAFLGTAVDRLATGGRLAVITFHSLEDRIVKHTFRGLATAQVLTKRPVGPGEEELGRNPRARSAKLRAVERT